eukprot:scaffold116978_cov46-Phaeocystis_antarctica.AAC.2
MPPRAPKCLARSARSKQSAPVSRCRTPIQALAQASQAGRSTRSPASASILSCPSPPNSPDRHATAAHTSSSSTRVILESAAFTLAMSARATSSSAGVGRGMRLAVRALPMTDPLHNRDGNEDHPC